MLATAVFSEAQAWQRRQDGDQLITQIDTLWAHSDLTTQPSPLPLPDEVVEHLVLLRSWSVCQLMGSADLDRAITLASTVRAECRRLLSQEHPLSQTVAANLQRARTRPPRRRWWRTRAK